MALSLPFDPAAATPIAVQRASSPARSGLAPASTPRATWHAMLAVTLLVASLDFGFACAWWVPRGATVAGVLQAMASWLVDPRMLPAVLVPAVGFAVHAALHSLGVVALWRWLRPRDDAWQAKWLIGIPYGLLAYAATYEVLVPLLLNPVTAAHTPAWIAACAVFHSFVIGPVTASALAAAARRRAGSG